MCIVYHFSETDQFLCDIIVAARNFNKKSPQKWGLFLRELPTGEGDPRQKYYNKIPKHEKMKCGIIEEDYTRTNEKRLIGAGNADKP